MSRKELIKRTLVDIFSIAAPVAILFIAFNLVISVAKCESASMENTFMTGDAIVQNKAAYLIKKPERGDIICFKNDQTNGNTFVKRIIGMPGEVISFDNGNVYVNGEVLDEPYLSEGTATYSWILAFVVPEDKYFVLGDNRGISADSRYWENPYVAKGDIISEAIYAIKLPYLCNE